MTAVRVCVCVHALAKQPCIFPVDGYLPHCGEFVIRWPLKALPNLLQSVITGVLPTRYQLLRVDLVT